MIEILIINIVGFILTAFSFWRKLKDDYVSEIIFNCFFLIIFGLVGGLLISLKFAGSWWFWLGIVGIVFGYFISYKKYKLNFYECQEALIVSFSPWLFLIFANHGVLNRNIYSLGNSVLILLLIVLYLFLNRSYKDFAWYKSGRVGFAGLTTAGVYFLLRGVIAIFFSSMLSFVEVFDPIVSGLSSFIFFLMLYNLSRSKD